MGYNINYSIDGSGDETIVILQGWGTTIDVYSSLAQLLSAKYCVIRLDLPGFGKSDEPKESWSVDEYVDFFLKFLKDLNIKKAILIGHSYGGRMIIKIASRKRAPIELSKIVLIDSAGVLPHRTTIQRLKIRRYKILKRIANIGVIKKCFSSQIEEWKSKQGSADYRNASPIMRQSLVKAVNEDLSDCLKDIKVETLLIWGDNDTATPLSDAHKMEKNIPNAGLAVIKNAGHFCFIDQPIVFNNIIKSYFKL
jgi:pimeloyl-ACP methyl ester carboxylesterase